MQVSAVSSNKTNDMGSTANGGGVNVNRETFTMESGVISGDTAGRLLLPGYTIILETTVSCWKTEGRNQNVELYM